MSSRVLPTIAIMLAIGIFFAYVRPVWNGPVAATKLSIQNNTDALVAAAEYKARENELAAARNAIDASNLERLATFLPDSVDNVTLILNINALAARSGILLSNVDVIANKEASAKKVSTGSAAAATPPSGTSLGPVGSVDLALTAVGSYAALQTFLAGIEKSARLLDVRDIVVTSTETGVYSYKMTMRLYWLR
jgi:hypothetical protein